MAKLRRHLGESILDEAVYARRRSSIIVTPVTKEMTLRQPGERVTYLRAGIAVEKILNLGPEESGNEEEEEEEDARIEEYSWVSVNGGTAFRAFSGRRHSRKWMREKGGRRWEESDYKAVLQALRSL